MIRSGFSRTSGSKRIRALATRVCVALILAILAAPTAVQAGLGFSFQLWDNAWRATDIVVVTEGASVDGVLTVLETWKGSLEPGTVVKIDEFSEFANEDLRTVRYPDGFWSTTYQRHPPILLSGQRLILFLKRPQSPSSLETPDALIPWEPAARWGGIKVSAAWVEKGQVYVWKTPGSLTNRGIRRLYPYLLSEDEIWEQVSESVAIQEALLEVAEELDVYIRIDRALKFYARVYGPVDRPGSVEALRIISDAGEPALPALRQLLADKSYWGRYREISAAMAKAGGETVAPEFVEMIARELDFWQATAPSLPDGWHRSGSGFDQSEGQALGRRIGYLSAVLSSLSTLKYEGARHTVTELRDFWAFTPQLADIDSVIVKSDALLDALDAAAPQ